MRSKNNNDTMMMAYHVLINIKIVLDEREKRKQGTRKRKVAIRRAGADINKYLIE